MYGTSLCICDTKRRSGKGGRRGESGQRQRQKQRRRDRNRDRDRETETEIQTETERQREASRQSDRQIDAGHAETQTGLQRETGRAFRDPKQVVQLT